MSVRVSPDLKRRLYEASSLGPYKVTVTNIIERGIELALKELSDLRKSK